MSLILLPYILSIMGYLLAVLKVPLLMILFICSYTPIRRTESHCALETSQISALEGFENDVIRKRRANYIDSCSPIFVKLTFASQSFSESGTAEFEV